MKERLLDLLKNSKSNYYNYSVSSIIVCNDGKTFEGVNVETSSPSAGICAERNALFNAITNGYKKGDFKEIHVMSKNGVYPCFICRQALVDFCSGDTKIITYDIEGNTKEVTLKDLIPYSFSDGDIV